MRRFFAVLVGAALAASLVGVSVALVLRAQERVGPDAAHTASVANAVAHALREQLAQMHARLRDLCAHDVRVERLALELASLGEAEQDASYAARSLAATHGHSFVLLTERRGTLRSVGASGSPPSPQVQGAVLQEAARGPVAVGRAEPQIWMACQRGESGRSLWVVQSLAPEGLSKPWQLKLSTGETSASGTEVLRIAGALDAAPLAFTLESDPFVSRAPLSLVLGLIGAAGLLGALGALVLSARFSREDAVLETLERAAERVAEGDLTSTIDLRVGGRADQTFATFDRMTHELREMRAKLAEAERAAAFQDIARRIAHEIKNPLSPIRVSIETLRKAHAKKHPDFDEIFEESTRTVLDEVRRMERIVREFSEFARLPKPEPGELSLPALADEVLRLYQPADVEVALEAAEDVPNVRADREQLTQVLINLLQNAFDAARANAHPKVCVRVVRDARGVTLHVDDNGPGVPPSERARIFEPYVTRKEHGTGLGLAIVKRIVSDHKASIEVSESPLGGARFSVRFDHSASLP